MIPVSWLLLALLAGAAAYSLLSLIAARHYLCGRGNSAGQPLLSQAEIGVSIIKPLSGSEPGLEENLRSFFEQDYSLFELIFTTKSIQDPAVAIVRRLQEEYPHVSSQLLCREEPACLNPKIAILLPAEKIARHDILVLSDSDVRVCPAMLRSITAEFEVANVGLITCPYRAVPGDTFWSRLEAIGMNTEFLGGVITARMMDGMRFALGALIAVRRESLDRIGGLIHLGDYLADDFRIGQAVAECGQKVVLSHYVVEHHIGPSLLAGSFRHRLRWARSTRRSRPLGYLGQLFTYPIPLALIAALWGHPVWAGAPLTIAGLRVLTGLVLADRVLHDSSTWWNWWLIPLQDLLSFCVYIAGFFGTTIVWRERSYRVVAGGKLFVEESI